MQRIALVYIDTSGDNFFIEDCPDGPPENWIGRFVYNVKTVEHVEVYELGNLLNRWSNPNVTPEE